MTTKAKPTPGPWTVYTQPGGGHIAITGADSTSFAFMTMIDISRKWRTQQAANARLIAAAPELLEALHALVKELTDLSRTLAEDGGEDSLIDEWEVLLALANAAITKAKGESS